MKFDQPYETPFTITFTFETLIDKIKVLAKDDPFYAKQNEFVLNEIKNKTFLCNPLTENSLEEHDLFYKQLLKNIFSPLLTKNEIKAIGIPFANIIYHPTQRFENIIKNAGDNFYLKLNGFSEDQFYILSCCVILDLFYGTNFRIDIPFIYDIPSKEGYISYYRVLTNADFLTIKPTSTSIMLSEEEIKELVDNYNNIALWKEKFPPNSWELYGFGIITMYDATSEVAISNLKSQLIHAKDDYSNIKGDVTEIFRSFFRISDLEIGYTGINYKENKFEISPINTVIESKILSSVPKKFLADKIQENLLNQATEQRKYFSISDIDRFSPVDADIHVLKNFKALNIKSAILTPLYKNGKLLGILEITSPTKSLNSINANKIDEIIIYLEDTINQLNEHFENHVVAIIQQEYTAIHPSVYWKFHDEAMKHVNILGEPSDKLPYKSISFGNLIPFYGQSDVRNSSVERNNAILKDIKNSLDHLISLLQSLTDCVGQSQLIEKINIKKKELTNGLKANTETEIQLFLQQEIYPKLDLLKFKNLEDNEKITLYFKQIEDNASNLYFHRKQFDDSISMINKELSNLIDKRHDEQQQRFPFYYERFKTDGVEHHFYMGASIAPWLSYDNVYLKNLRIWQLRLVTESEMVYKKLSDKLPTKLDITSLIFVYSTAISIRFRMDEKRFDVDGSYNARYEMIKKRIDKSLIKNTTERLVKVGKISIVFSLEEEKTDYLKYIAILQSEGYLLHDTEIVELEDLQGISGLKALRVGVNYEAENMRYEFYPKI